MAEDVDYLRLLADRRTFPIKRPLTLAQLERLFALTDWRFVLLEKEIESRYGDNGATALAVTKALVLPYLVELPSESALARRMSEDISLRLLCQYPLNKETTEIAIRSVMWRFRNGFSREYLDHLLLKALIALVLSGRRPNMELPFVIPLDFETKPPPESSKKIQLDPYHPDVFLWSSRPDIRTGIPMHELRERYLLAQQLAPIEQKSTADRLQLPAIVRTKMQSGEPVNFGIVQPPWFDPRYPIGGKDTSSSLSAGTHQEQYACNVIVLRQGSRGPEVLLSQRLAGFRSGEFTLPGGRQMSGESLEGCANRELMEETGLRMIKSRPVSMFLHRMSGKSPVHTIGALAEVYKGTPRHKEPTQNSAWSWYPLDNLPSPLFEPSEVSLRQHMEKRFPDLTWSDIEAPVPAKDKSVLEDNNQRSFIEAGLLNLDP